MRRRDFLLALGASAAGATLLAPRLASAGGTVPAGIQAQLVAKVSSFDRNFAARAGASAGVLIVHRPNDADSQHLAAAVAKSLTEMSDIAGKQKQVEIVAFAGAPALAARCKAGKVALLYLSSGFTSELGAIAASLQGTDLLSFGATAQHAASGTVVAFDLEEGKPKLVVHGARAKAQNVSFKAELLKLARLVG